MGGFAKDMIQGRTCSHCGIMFEQEPSKTPVLLRRTKDKKTESTEEEK
jgi:hypothetical protein